MKNIVLAALLFTCGAFIVSCEGEGPEKQLAQDKYIEAFVNDLKSQYYRQIGDSLKTIYYNGGATNVVWAPGDTLTRINSGDSVIFSYVAYILPSGTTKYPYDTNIKDSAKSMNLDTIHRNFEPVRQVVGEGNLLSGLDKGLLVGHNGAYSFIVFDSDLGYGSNGTGIVPEYTALVFEVFIQDVKKN